MNHCYAIFSQAVVSDELEFPNTAVPSPDDPQLTKEYPAPGAAFMEEYALSWATVQPDEAL